MNFTINTAKVEQGSFHVTILYFTSMGIRETQVLKSGGQTLFQETYGVGPSC